jgi:predicted O-linked N-acetylglucosamine transferase (SPINDLY family)
MNVLGCLTTHDALANAIPMVTLPLEHVRGRYTHAMYLQMGVQGLVANSMAEYIEIALRLFRDKPYRDAKSNEIEVAYYQRFNKNEMVAQEWLGLIKKLILASS